MPEHPVHPPSDLRLKLKSHLSVADTVELEGLIIQELGCICDQDRADGCLVNLRQCEYGPLAGPLLEARLHELHQMRELAAASRQADVVCMTEERVIIARDNARALGRLFDVCNSMIISCCKHKAPGIWQPSHSRALYFCYYSEYESYVVIPMTDQASKRYRILIAQKLDGSDICCGTAGAIGRCREEIKQASRLHDVALGDTRTAYGWTARYADDIDTPLEELTTPAYSFY